MATPNVAMEVAKDVILEVADITSAKLALSLFALDGTTTILPGSTFGRFLKKR